MFDKPQNPPSAFSLGKNEAKGDNKVNTPITVNDFNNTFSRFTPVYPAGVTQEDVGTKPSPIEDEEYASVYLDSSEMSIGGKPIMESVVRVTNIALDQNTKDPSQAFMDAQTSIERSPDGDQGAIFLKETAKALSGYISRILKNNKTIIGSTGREYTNTELASYILAYLDKENFQGTGGKISIPNNTFYLNANVLLLEKIKQKLLKNGKNEEWKAILTDIQDSCKL